MSENNVNFFNRLNSNLRKIGSKFIDLFFSTYIGLDITASEVRLVTTKRSRIRKWASVPLAEGVIKDGIIQEPQTLGLVIDNLLTSMKLARNHVICSVTGFPFVYRVINMPYTDSPIDREAIERAAKKEMSLSETDMYLFWRATERHAEVRERDFLVFGVPRHAVNFLVDALDKAGVKRYALDIKPLSLARAVSVSDAILASIEKEYVDVVVIAGGIIRVMHGFAPLRNEDFATFTREVFNGMSSAVKSFGRDYPNIPLPADAPVLTFGEFANNTEIINFLAENSGHPVSSVESPAADLADMPVPQFSDALGLIWKVPTERPLPEKPSDYKDININFFSGLTRPLMERFKIGYAVTALLVVGLAALTYFSYDFYRQASAKVDSLTAENEVASLQLTRAQNLNKTTLASKTQETANLKKLQDQQTALEKERQYLDSLQIALADEIVFITGALPSGSTFSQISLNANGYSIRGETASLGNVLSYSDALEKDSSFVTLVRSVQPAVDSDRVTFDMSITRK